MPDAQCIRSLVCEVVVQNAHEYSQRSHRKSPGIPARNGFNGFLRDLPGDRLFCHRRLADTSAKLERQRRGVRTTRLLRPHERCSSRAPLRPPHPVPTFVTMANAPLSGPDGGDRKVICVGSERKYFCFEGWTADSLICPSGCLDGK